MRITGTIGVIPPEEAEFCIKGEIEALVKVSGLPRDVAEKLAPGMLRTHNRIESADLSFLIKAPRAD